ncbi:NAD-dependent epimerase/dehydratase family protein [Piscinibacter sakaiensis]|uniref:NAD-dependent epimerase/dehydratase family protein n=1 Tax=Piscinibacter sakaiensis TaxID=1547922 RepID=UPI003AABDB04
MQLLILGGTGWLGGQIVHAALERGHEVTCLARAKTGALPDGAAFVKADRTQPDAYETVRTTQWDAVIDVASQPGQVRAAAAALMDRVGTYIYVSSASVYASHARLDEDEQAEILPALESDVLTNISEYGRAKVACEQIVRDAFGSAGALIVRPGLIGGPGDKTDRSGYWPLRFARASQHGRDVLLPDNPKQQTQLIDVRDLAQWLVDCASRGVSGSFNASGAPTPFAEHIRFARAVAEHQGPVKAAPSDWLTAQGVAPWMGPRSLPLWLPMADHAGFGARSSAKAVQAGLRRRALQDTLRDTLAWELTRQPLDRPRQAGLSDADENELLQALAASKASPREQDGTPAGNSGD